jgi:outer membrane lipoprotein carrier protein
MIRFLAVGLALSLGGGPLLQAGTPRAAAARRALPQLLREVEDKYAKAATLSAEFTQVTESSAMGTRKTSSGVIQARRPDKVRWETRQPFPSLLISDGTTFWNYTPPVDADERGQLATGKTSKFNTKLASALLAGSFSSAQSTFRVDGATRFTLVPRKGTAGTVREATVVVDPVQRTIVEVTLLHQGGNKAVITLKAIELGKALDDSLFRFEVPPNTDVEKL